MATEIIDDFCKDCEFSAILPLPFVQDETRFYVRKWKNRGRPISVLEPTHFTQIF